MGTLYTTTAVSGLEFHLDDCTHLFLSKMNEIIGPKKAGKVDIAAWLQYYAFDSLGAVNFSQMLGFLESGTDVDGICHLDHEQMMYFAVVCTRCTLLFICLSSLTVASGDKSPLSSAPGRRQSPSSPALGKRTPFST